MTYKFIYTRDALAPLVETPRRLRGGARRLRGGARRGAAGRGRTGHW